MSELIEQAEKLIDPEPTGETMLVIARVKLNTRFVWRKNGVGLPIMQVYPKDNSKVKDRIQIAKGKLILVYKMTITADGGGQYWCMAGSQKRYGTTLYVRKNDVKKTG